MIAAVTVGRADDGDVIQKRIFRDADGEHGYGVFIPRGYTPEKKWPVILFLHGAGERGRDGDRQLNVGLGPVVRQKAGEFPFIVVFPQCEATQARYLVGWVHGSRDARRALAILESVEKEFSVDPKRRVLTGWSMGGYGTWSVAAANPDHWSAIVPLAGGGTPEMAKPLVAKHVWAFHGSDDAAIRSSQSRRMITALREAGGQPRYTEVTGGSHDITELVYGNDQLIAWMLNPDKSQPAALALSVKQASPGNILASESDAADSPFSPAVVLKGAAKVRLGNRMLDALAMSIPEMLPKDLLSGNIDDINDSTVVEGRNFNITFGNIRYSTELFRIRVKAYKQERVNVQIGLRNASLRIGGTSVVGRDHAASAGPIDIVIGHRYPVWVSFDVSPYIEQGKLRLKLIASRFEISNDNWYVTQPAGVSVRGFGMTRRKVSEGLVSGLYGNRRRIEREVRSIVPGLVAEMEKQLALDDADQVVGSFWPLPVYKPRVRVVPQAVAVDEKGVSLILAVEAAAVDGTPAPETPQTYTVAELDVNSVSDSDNLEIAVAPNMLQYLTGMLVDSGVARIHVLDIPEASFDTLVDIEKMSTAIPGLKTFGPDAELWTELVLAEPIQVSGRAVPESVSEPAAEPAETDVEQPEKNSSDVQTPDTASTENTSTESVSDGRPGKQSGDADGATAENNPEDRDATGPKPIVFSAPRLRFVMKVRTDPLAEWVPYGEFIIGLEQAAVARLMSPQPDTRALQLEWSGAPDVSLTFKPADSKPETGQINRVILESIFREAWQGWTGLGPASQTLIPDLDFGLTKLRLNDAGWSAPWLGITFSPPGVKLTNSTDQPLIYETRGPYSSWGGPYTLEVGKTHRYDIAYPMTWRTRTGGMQSEYTLIPGSHSEFRIPRKGGKPELFRARENLEVVSTPGSSE